MAISPHDIRARQFTTVKRGGYDQREVEAFRTAAAEALEQATQEATAMEARARAAVARLQELQQQPPSAPAAEQPGAPSAAEDETATISRTLLLAQRTADTTIAEAEREAVEIVETAKAESRKAGEAERVRVEGEVQALLARRDFLESDVDQLDQFLATQRERITAVATDLNDITTRVGNGLGPMRQPQLSASNADHSGEVAGPAEGSLEPNDGEEEADVAELIDQVSSTDVAESAVDEREGNHSLFTTDEPRQ
ncbi:MAG TPA: DivIVA domain-containing protein [Desertimonas sp.]|nr:DivIVA domain-containing protein [Desertimonas sp.]